jgi:spermidine/putrescine transport system permease protein
VDGSAAGAVNFSFNRSGWLAAAPALLFTLVFFILPFIGMAVASLTAKGAAFPTLSNYAQFFGKWAYFQGMVNSLEITAIVTVISILVAYPFAWILANKVPERWQRLALLLAVLPFWTSYVVRSYAWLLVLAEQGIVNDALQWFGLISEPVQLANSRFATVTGFVHFFVMLLTLTIYANLKQLSPNYQKAAADLGASPLRVFWHVILPLTLPGIIVGAFLTFVLAIGDYVTPQILGGNTELVMPQVIMMQFQRRNDIPLSSALSIILMMVITIAYIACARWLKLERI